MCALKYEGMVTNFLMQAGVSLSIKYARFSYLLIRKKELKEERITIEDTKLNVSEGSILFFTARRVNSKETSPMGLIEVPANREE